MDRYARQIAIGGWTGFLCTLMATALGFGRIVMVGRGKLAIGLAHRGGIT